MGGRLVTDPGQQPRRVIAGHRMPGERLRAFTAAGEISLRSAAPAAPTQLNRTTGGKMTTAPLPKINTSELIRFEAWDASESLVVSVRGPVKVAAEAARNWADVVDPYVGPPGLDMRFIGWRDWLSKLLPFLRQR
jgi:hypothetical protein